MFECYVKCNISSLLVVDKNWAKGKHATQSSTHLKQGADLATDGNTNCTGVSSWSQTHASDRHPWWIVDLQQTIAISAVTIYTCPQTCRMKFCNIIIVINIAVMTITISSYTLLTGTMSSEDWW